MATLYIYTISFNNGMPLFCCSKILNCHRPNYFSNNHNNDFHRYFYLKLKKVF